MEDENHDVFGEEDTVTTATDENEEAGNDEATGTPKAEEEGTEDTTQQGDENAEPPAADGDKGSASEKMIPESRFKAALGDVTKKLEEATSKLAKYETAPMPDKNTDPEAYELRRKVDMSREMARDTYSDYDEKILHFNEMAKANPTLWDIVAKDGNPAKLAYNLAVKDLNIREAEEFRKSDDFKQFQEWKKSQQTGTAPTTQASAAAKQLTANATPKVPNLNKTATASSPTKVSTRDNDDDLWTGHHNRA